MCRPFRANACGVGNLGRRSLHSLAPGWLLLAPLGRLLLGASRDAPTNFSRIPLLLAYSRGVSFTELKQEVPRLSDGELAELAACIREARSQRDPGWLSRAEQINDEMAAGRKFTEADLLRIDEELRREGR